MQKSYFTFPETRSFFKSDFETASLSRCSALSSESEEMLSREEPLMVVADSLELVFDNGFFGVELLDNSLHRVDLLENGPSSLVFFVFRIF